MGMIASLTTVSDANIGKLVEDPLLVVLLEDRGDRHFYDKAREREQPGWFGRLTGRKAPAHLDPALFVIGPDEGENVDLDKAWHGLHYLFTKTDWSGEPPLDFLVNRGRDIDENSRAFTAAEVADIDIALRPIDLDCLRARFDAADMDRLDIYPLAWSEADGALDYVMEYFDNMKEIIRRAAERNLGMVVSCG